MVNNGRFADILLQSDASNHLQRSFANGRIAQTYLFSGRESTGRMMTALAFSALLQCESPVKGGDGLFDSCGNCDSCKRIFGFSHPDVVTIVPDGYEIRIDQVRALQESASLKPSSGKWQIFILDPAEKLNTSSANSLLKILEEAPSHVVFILLARDTDSLLPTILSRCEVVRFAIPSHQQAREILSSSFDMNPEVAARCYALSEGCFGQALKFAENYTESTFPYGIRASHTDYLIELEKSGLVYQEEFALAKNMDEILRKAEDLGKNQYISLQIARKSFCRSLAMTSGLPAAFPLLFSENFCDRLDHVTRIMKKSLEPVLAEAKKSYGSSLFKDFDSQIEGALNLWSVKQMEDFFIVLVNWYADALIMASGGEETLLLNLDHKEDIITVAEVDGIALIRSRIDLLDESVRLFRRHVQPQLILENVITQIGGTEA